jgi:hypothetical protein
VAKIKYKEIANLINKSESTIKGYKLNNPELLDLLKLGSSCKINNITLNDLDMLIQFKKIQKEQILSNTQIDSSSLISKVNEILSLK